MAFHPYLFFGGNCREAFTLYSEVFGGELFLISMADMPSDDQNPEINGDLIAHAALMIDGQLLMGSDDPTTDAFGPVQGMMVNYTAADAADANRVFDGLSAGGTVTMAMSATSWSPLFGMCIDRFGTPWMIGIDEPVEEA